MLQVLFYDSVCLQLFYTVIFMFHFPYMDVYFKLPISKIIHIATYIYTIKRMIFYMYIWIIFENGRYKVDIQNIKITVTFIYCI